MSKYTVQPVDEMFHHLPRQGVEYLVLVQQSNYDNCVCLTKGHAFDVELKMNMNQSASAQEYYDLGTLLYNFHTGLLGGKSVQVTISDAEYAAVRQIAIALRIV